MKYRWIKDTALTKIGDEFEAGEYDIGMEVVGVNAKIYVSGLIVFGWVEEVK